jgi:hypothetical protein
LRGRSPKQSGKKTWIAAPQAARNDEVRQKNRTRHCEDKIRSNPAHTRHCEGEARSNPGKNKTWIAAPQAARNDEVRQKNRTRHCEGEARSNPGKKESYK